jgi:hypothetical protein
MPQGGYLHPEGYGFGKIEGTKFRFFHGGTFAHDFITEITESKLSS